MARTKKEPPYIHVNIPPWMARQGATVEYWMLDMILQTEEHLKFLLENVESVKDRLMALRQCVIQLPARVRNMPRSKLKPPESWNFPIKAEAKSVKKPPRSKPKPKR